MRASEKQGWEVLFHIDIDREILPPTLHSASDYLNQNV